MAIENINNKTDGIYDDILPQTQLETIFRSCENKFYLGATNAKSLLEVSSEPVMANIGPFGDATLRAAVPTFDEADHVPVFGFHDRAAALANTDYFPNFFRTIPGMFVDGRAIASLISKYFRWNQVTIFSSLTESSRASSLTFLHYAIQYKIDILSSHVLSNSQIDVSNLIRSAKKSGSRIFVLFLDPARAKMVMEQGIKLKLFTDQTQIIGGEEFSTIASWDSMNLLPQTITTLLKGVIGVRLHRYSPPGELQNKFLQKWKAHRSTTGQKDVNGVQVCDRQMDSYNSSYLYQYSPDVKNSTPICAGLNYSSYSSSVNFTQDLLPVMYAYDAALSVAMGLHHLLYSANNFQPTPTDLHDTLLHNVTFFGLTGEVSFATDMTDDLFNVGGRATGILYDILNFATSDSFVPVLQWHSEEGFTTCDGIPYFEIGNPCHRFQFQSKHPPTDSPLPVMVQMSSTVRLFLRLLAVTGLFFSILVVLVIYSYYSRRLVKISQPLLANFKRFGIFVGFIRVLLATFDLTKGTCISLLWLEQLAFQMIFATISVRCWRVYRVTGSLKRVKVTDRQCMTVIMANIISMTLLLIATMFTEKPDLQVVTVTKNQDEYLQEYSCRYSSPLIPVMYAYDLLVLATGLWLCWLIRKVGSTVSNTPALIEGLTFPNYLSSSH
jgi:ABC-type branched-subunit amino acid transport system substrate-binding protein